MLPVRAAEKSAEPKFPWMTRQGAILCQNYFSMKDAKAAVAAGDLSWLQKTGCVQAVGGLKIILIDAPLGSPDLLWKGRMYPPGEAAEGANVYFGPYHVLTYAFVTAPLSDLVSGDKAIDFKSATDAEKWYEKNVSKEDKKYLSHSAIDAGDGRYRIMLGPAPYGLLQVSCRYVRPSCHIVGQLP